MKWETKASMLKPVVATLLGVLLAFGHSSVQRIGAVEAEQDSLGSRHKGPVGDGGQEPGTSQSGVEEEAAGNDVDASDPGEEEPIVIARGEEREFPISGKGSASRTIRIKHRFSNPLIPLPSQDELTQVFRMTKGPLCLRILREAKQKALNDCKKKGREIAKSVRCEKTGLSPSGNHEKQLDQKPRIKKLQCSVVYPPKECEWSFRLIANKVHVIRVNQKYFDPRSQKWKSW